ncbi:hypothetical protein [Caulobacter sp. S45]|uniref:hypothetical protein n=1 Tax=Caulobacter sp. S45 TaxID=1641861 RepID=UPI001577689A|nr:hypothetical protein [Caulobacter sp. S45]
MTIKTSLLRGAALGTVLVLSAGLAANATTTTHTHKKVVRRQAAESAPRGGGEIAALREEVAALRNQLNVTQAQSAQAAAAAQAATEQVETAQAADADATAAIIQSIPVAVAAEADKLKPKTDGFYFKGVKITPGGFVEAAGIYREHNLASDVATPFNSVPYTIARPGHAEELRATARQSRITGLVEGNINPDIKLSAYGEFDFLGAAQTANLNESNSFNLRTRVVYATMDFADEGFHLLAGDEWSLATMNSKGITPRNEVLPPNIDAQYNVGYVWARQPQFRITKDFLNKTLWAAVSVENPQTTFGGSAPSAAGVLTTINNGSNYYGGDTGTLSTTTVNGVVTAVSGVAPATQSLNHVPDVIGKLAAEEDVFGHHLHAEVFGMYRQFYEQLGTLKSNSLDAGSVGGGVAGQIIPDLLDLQVTGISGKGVGRYGSSGLPDVAFTPSGKITAIQETAGLVTATLHATKTLDLYFVGGEEQDERPDGGMGSYGNFTAVNTGCGIEASTLTCTGNTRRLSELTFQAWDKAFTGPYGQIRLGLQYSYVAREGFGGVGGSPEAHDNMILTSIRYYPF